MFRIFVNAKSLAHIYLSEGERANKRNQSDWFRILMKQRDLFTEGYNIPSSISALDPLSDEYVLFLMSQNNPQIGLTPADDYLSSIAKHPDAVLQYPKSIFWFDIDPKQAKKIQKDYGVLVQPSSKKFDTKCITREIDTYSFKQHKRIDASWKDIYSGVASMQGNAICLVDRNLFAYDGQLDPHTGKEQANGLYNVFFILDSALPKGLKTNFDVTILTEQRTKAIKNPESGTENIVIDNEFMDRLSNSIFGLIPSLKRNYEINVEIIAFKKSTNNHKVKFYNDTHNRRIFSNYYTISADLGLNAINYGDLQKPIGMYSQEITRKTNYSTGLRSNSSSPIEDSNRMCSVWANFINYWRKNCETNDYWYASNSEKTFKNHKNRLFY